MAKPTEDLQKLINKFSRGGMELPDFKKEAFFLIKNGADLSVHGDNDPYNTLLHCLVLSNEKGVNDQEITEVLGLKKAKVDVKNGYLRTALSCLIDQFQKKQCSVDDFKRSALLLAQHGADLSVHGNNDPYNTLLHCLVLSNKEGVNDQAITEVLGLKKAKVDVQNGYSRTALSCLIDQFQKKQCILDDFKRSALLLAQHGADLSVHSDNDPYNTLLHCLVLSNKEGVNDQAITEVLGLKKAKVDVQNGYSRTALICLIDQFQKKQCSIDDFKRSALLLAQHGADLSVQGNNDPYNTLLHCLVLSNKEGVNDQAITEVLGLKKDKIDVKNGYGRTILTCLIDQFQKKQCSVDDFKRSALLLAQHGADLRVRGDNAPYNTLLHCLVLSNEEGVNDTEIATLVKLKHDIFHVENAYGYLPIEALLIEKPTTTLNVIKKLIDVGNALNYSNSRGKNLVHTSSRIGNLELTQYLAGRGIDVTTKTKEGMTALHYSVDNNNPELWQWLFDNKVDIDAQNCIKQTALHLAGVKGNINMVQWLIEHHADVSVQDFHGDTALSLAKVSRQQKIIDLLTEAEKNPKVRLFSTLRALKEYGVDLKEKGASKGQHAVDLAEALWSKADAYFKQENTPETYKAFQTEFSQVLHSKHKEMSEYRTSWSTIIANIAIALTGIGALLLVGHLIYTKGTQGRALFFFQKSKTTGEENIDIVENAIIGLGG
jgi:ankyrin repeat protein